MPKLITSKAAKILLTMLVFGITGRPRCAFASRAKPASPVSVGVSYPNPRSLQSDDTLEGIKANQSQEERIGLLKRFIVGNRGTNAELQGREMLMQEYALKGEQALKERVPWRTSVDFNW